VGEEKYYLKGYEIEYLSEWDGLPVKNHLPEELKESFFTRIQWWEKGYEVKESAEGTFMHPSALAKRLCEYFFRDEVEARDNNSYQNSPWLQQRSSESGANGKK